MGIRACKEVKAGSATGDRIGGFKKILSDGDKGPY